MCDIDVWSSNIAITTNLLIIVYKIAFEYLFTFYTLKTSALKIEFLMRLYYVCRKMCFITAFFQNTTILTTTSPPQ